MDLKDIVSSDSSSKNGVLSNSSGLISPDSSIINQQSRSVPLVKVDTSEDTIEKSKSNNLPSPDPSPEPIQLTSPMSSFVFPGKPEPNSSTESSVTSPIKSSTLSVSTSATNNTILATSSNPSSTTYTPSTSPPKPPTRSIPLSSILTHKRQLSEQPLPDTVHEKKIQLSQRTLKEEEPEYDEYQQKVIAVAPRPSRPQLRAQSQQPISHQLQQQDSNQSQPQQHQQSQSQQPQSQQPQQPQRPQQPEQPQQPQQPQRPQQPPQPPPPPSSYQHPNHFSHSPPNQQPPSTEYPDLEDDKEFLPIGPSGMATIAVMAPTTISSTSVSSRRHAHILSEQRRRENINGGFKQLKNAVPFCKGTQDSKATILKKAVEYITSLEQELNMLRNNKSSPIRNTHIYSDLPPPPSIRPERTVSQPSMSSSQRDLEHESHNDIQINQLQHDQQPHRHHQRQHHSPHQPQHPIQRHSPQHPIHRPLPTPPPPPLIQPPPLHIHHQYQHPVIPPSAVPQRYGSVAPPPPAYYGYDTSISRSTSTPPSTRQQFNYNSRRNFSLPIDNHQNMPNPLPPKSGSQLTPPKLPLPP